MNPYDMEARIALANATRMIPETMEPRLDNVKDALRSARRAVEFLEKLEDQLSPEEPPVGTFVRLESPGGLKWIAVRIIEQLKSGKSDRWVVHSDKGGTARPWTWRELVMVDPNLKVIDFDDN